MEEKKQSYFNVRHSQNIGDIMYSMGGIKAICDKSDLKAHLFYWLNRPAQYYTGAIHPTMDDSTGETNVMLNFKMFDMLKPLLESQPFIDSVNVWQGEDKYLDLDRIRQVNINVPHGDIRKWYQYVYPDMAHDTSLPVITLPLNENHASYKYPAYILVNRTQRYLSHYISYMFLRHYPKVLFAGTVTEYELFRMQVPGAIHLQVRDFLELAYWIQNAQLFCGNQSFCYAVAEQMKTKRVLEICAYAQNVIPSGPNGYDYFAQSAFEYYVEKLWNNETP